MVGKLIFISTCSNYGLINQDLKADENFELKPLSLYAKAKVEIENFILNKQNKKLITNQLYLDLQLHLDYHQE